LAVHLVHPTGEEHGQTIQELHCCSHVLAGPGEVWMRRPLIIDGGSEGPGSSLGLGEVDGCGPLHLERSLVAV
jgi:hypothetical protein